MDIDKVVLEQVSKALAMAQTEAITMIPRLTPMYAKNQRIVADTCGAALKALKAALTPKPVAQSYTDIDELVHDKEHAGKPSSLCPYCPGGSKAK